MIVVAFESFFERREVKLVDLKNAPPCIYGNNTHTRIKPKNREELALPRESLK